MNRLLRTCTATTGLAVLAAGLAVPALAGEPAPREAVAAQPVEQRQQHPNVLVWMLDDVGFAQLSCFGGLIATPNIDRVAGRGVRYSNYYTTPVCSPSRAAFITGRNSHTVNMGGHNMFARDLPGYNGRIPASAGTIAENLRQGGYTTFALGKWDHLPIRQTSPSGPFTYWPQGQGFDRFYGFIASETDNFHPEMWRDAVPVNPGGKDYHLNNDLADEAIDMIRSRDAGARPGPFFMYWATGTAHAPHHAPREWIERYKGKFDMGWDKARARILKQQIEAGIVPRGTKLAPRPEAMQAWDGLTADQQRLYARQMEVFAAALSHADEQFGRILDELERRGELDNTVIVVTSDNGASAEGGIEGLFNEMFFTTDRRPDAGENLRYYDEWGGPRTYPHYAFGWAVTGNTPYRYYKQTTFEGGIHVPLIISAPKAKQPAGSWSTDFAFVADLQPTILELAGVEPARIVNGVTQSPFDGISIAYTLSGQRLQAPQRSQYFEMFGHRGFVSGDWKIVSPSRLNTWDITAGGKLDNPWQLYNIHADPGEVKNLADADPARVGQLARGFEEQAERFHVNPIGDIRTAMVEGARTNAADMQRRHGRWTYTGPISRIDKWSQPPIEQGGFTATAKVDLASGTETGPLFVRGDHYGGTSFYLKDGKPKFLIKSLWGDTAALSASEAVGPGSHEIALRFGKPDTTPGEPAASDVSITVDGRIVASDRIAMPISAAVPGSFDIGRDGATPVTEEYAANVEFPGKLDRLVFDFSGQD